MQDKDNKAHENSDVQTIVEEKIVKVTGDVQIRKYNKGRLLGKGGFAKCFEFTCLDTKKISASKLVTKASLVKSRAKQKLISEIKIHKSLHHPNIVSFEHYFEDSENVYILLEMCHNQSMNELIKRRKRLTELETMCYLVQLIKALKYLHSHRVIHRDLKLGNLFLTDKMEVKVGDFGLATKLEFENEKKRTVCGTPNYIAPEILESKNGHSYEVDIWSLGVIMYTLIIGKPPFETQDVKTTYKRIKMNAYSFPEHTIISEAAKALITEILQTDPSKRPNLDQILAHDFFNQGNSIPKFLPTSTLACPPSLSYIKQFLPDVGNNGIVARITTGYTSNKDFKKDDSAPILQTQNTIGRSNNVGTERLKLTYGNTNIPTNRLETPTNGENYMSNRPFTTINAYNFETKKESSSNVNVLDKKAKTSSTSAYNPTTRNITQGPNIWVKRWVDYSSKYGLGYLLSNNTTGVFYNDSSKLILDTKTNNFSYIEKRQSDKQDIVTSHNINDYPKELQKKVTLLHHFRSYLEGEQNKEVLNDEELNKNDDENKLNNFVYVKKWMRTKHAIMFRLSNKIVQVCFQDHTEIILSSESRVVTYVNKKGERSTYPLSSALDSNNMEMTKRLKYTKDILTHMLTNNNQNNQGSTGTNNNLKESTSTKPKVLEI
jgi:polo-like kinase 1